MTFYFLFQSLCLVLINLSIITFFESFIIISSESRYHLDSLELCTTREQQHWEGAGTEEWAMKTINLNYSETNTSAKYQVDQDQSRKISDSSSQLFPVIPIAWTHQTWYFSHKMNFFFHLMNFTFLRRKFVYYHVQCLNALKQKVPF